MSIKKSIVFLALVTLVVLSTNITWARWEGDCAKSMFGHDESWKQYDAHGEIVEIRTCSSNGKYYHLDVKNPHNYAICITVMETYGNHKWNDSLEAGEILSKSVESGKGSNWRIGAHKKIHSYCE